MTVVVYDVEKQTFEVLKDFDLYDTDAFLKLCYKRLDCRSVDRAHLAHDLVAWVDDEGLYDKACLTIFTGYGAPLAGNVVFTGGDGNEGYSNPVPEKYTDDDCAALKSLVLGVMVSVPLDMGDDDA